jgi:RND family efflux transporter MFP subunit
MRSPNVSCPAPHQRTGSLHRSSLCGAAVLVLACSACDAQTHEVALPEAGAAARAVRIGRPSTRLETGLARATGVVRSRQEAVLAAKGSGQIKSILVQVGDRVRAGQPLVQMDAAMAAISVENGKALVRLAEASLASAELELKRAVELHQGQVMADATFDRVKTGREVAAAQLDQARAGLKMAEQSLRDTVISAPFAALVTGKFKSAGDSVTGMPITPVIALTDVDHLELRLAVPEGLAAFVQAGQKVSGVTTPGEQRFDAKVRVLNGVIEPGSRTVEVLADVVSVEGSPLHPGTLVNLDFGGFGDKDGLFVPTSALLGSGKERSLFALVAGKAERRTITGALVNPGVFAVQGGLDARTDVILDLGALKQGDAVVALGDAAAAPRGEGVAR